MTAGRIQQVMKHIIIVCAVVVLTASMATSAAARERAATQPAGSRSSSKARVIGTIAGAAGGFVLGIFAGLNWFDDATDSDRKVWLTAISFGAAGGVGGYFAGRAIGGRGTGPAPLIRPGPPGSPALPSVRLRAPSPSMPSRSATARLRAALAGPPIAVR